MEQYVLILGALLIILVALMVINSSIRLWVFKVFGIESRIEATTHQTKVTAKRTSTVKKVKNAGGTVEVEATDYSDIEDVGNIQK